MNTEIAIRLFQIMNMLIITGIMGVSCVLDVKKREIYMPVVWGGMVLALLEKLILWLIRGEIYDALGSVTGLKGAVLALLPGLAAFVIAVLTHEELGYGDAWIIMMLGLFFDIGRLLLIVYISIITAGLTALVMLCIFRKGRKTTLAYAPFATVGIGVSLIADMIR